MIAFNSMIKKLNPSLLERYLEVAREAAHTAGLTLVELRNTHSLSVRFKSERDPVSNADTASEALIISYIRSHFPDHLFLAEESSPHYTSLEAFRGAVWIIDPLDGTVNYAHGLNHTSISIALAIDGKVVAGVVYAPFLNELFCAAAGAGATLNGKPIHVSSTTDVRRSLVTTGFPYERADLDPIMQRLRNILAHCQDVRRLGSAAIDISYVACGRIDAFYENLQPWDIAAACLIAKEAGARLGHFGQRNSHSVLPEGLNGENLLVATPAVFGQVQSLLELHAAST